MRISYSQISSYQRCPHRYQLQYVQRLPVPKRGELLLGSIVHGALKFMHEPKGPRLPAEEEVIAEFCRLWKGEEENIPEGERTALFEDGVNMLRRHYERAVSRQEPRFTADVERFFSLPFGEGNAITGKIDRIDALGDGTIEVLDYKTGRRGMPVQGEVDRDLQLAIYRMAAQEMLYPDKTITTSLYYLHHGMTLTARFAPQQMEEVREEIREVVAGIERGDFSPRVEPWCDRCEYRAYCMVFRPVSVSVEEAADIEAMIRELAEVEDNLKLARAEAKGCEARYAELESAILQWLKEAGTGFYEAGNLQVLAKTKSLGTAFNIEAVKQILQPLGLWEKVCTVSVTKKAIEGLQRAGMISPAVAGQIWALGEKKEKPVIRLQRLGEEETGEAEE